MTARKTQKKIATRKRAKKAQVKTLKGKDPLVNFRAPAALAARFKAHAARVGVSQGVLLRRFLEIVPNRTGWSVMKAANDSCVLVDIGPEPRKVAA